MRNDNHFEDSKEQSDDALQLQRYKQKIANILESFTDGFFEVDQNWTVTYWNAEAERLLMMSKADIVGENLWESYQEAVPLKFYTEYHRAVNERIAVRFEEYFQPKDSWFEVAAFPSGEGLSVYFKDITATKNAKKALEEERQKYHDLFNFSPLPQWVYDVETLAFLQVNEAATIQYGYSYEEFLGMTIKDIRPCEGLAELCDIMATRVKPGQFNKSIVQHQKKDGTLIYVSVEGNSVSFEGRNARLVLAIDLTEKILAETELQLSLNRYDIVSKATSDAIWDWDIKTGHIVWNKGVKGIFGYENLAFDFSWWESNLHPDDFERVTEQFKRLISSNDSRQQIEYRFRCADGSYKVVLDRSFIIFDDQGQAVRLISSMQDISERVRDLQEIEAQNKLLREISWMQAHDVRGPLARIMGLSSLIHADARLSLEESREYIQLIKESADELDQVVKDIIRKSN